MAPLPNGMLLSTLSLLFLVSYATGMLVRYHPTTWQAMSGLRAGDYAFPLLKAAVSLVERRFPLEVLDQLEREWPEEMMISQPRLNCPSHYGTTEANH